MVIQFRLLWPEGGALISEITAGKFNIHFLGKLKTWPTCIFLKCVHVGQTQSSLGPFRQAPPPLAVSEAIQRPGSRGAEKTDLQSLGLCVDVSVAGGWKGGKEGGEEGVGS